MKSNHNDAPDQDYYDPETGEVDRETISAADVGDAAEMFGTGDGQQSDGSITLPKMSMAMIRGNPERAKLAQKPLKIAIITGMGGGELLMPPMDREKELEALGDGHPEYITFCAAVAAMEPWGAVRFDDQGDPDAVFKSDYLFLPIGHAALIQRIRSNGSAAIALEFWAQPAANPRGYSWYYVNLAKYDRNISPVDRLLKLGVQASRARELSHGQTGLLADLRSVMPVEPR